jgi:ribA/ribD-fused uncharacterized protein
MKEIFFWGQHSPFSNMYNCSINVDGSLYNCVEQLYTTKKADFFGDKVAKEKILELSDPIQQKRTYIRGYNNKEWEAVAEECMFNCVKAKFSRNDELHDILIKSYPKTLIELALTIGSGVLELECTIRL